MGRLATPQRAFQTATPTGPWLALIAVAILGFAASLIANWPGHFPPDAIWQLAQGRSGIYNAWHPPVMAWLLGLADRVIPGAPLFIVLQAALFFAALTAFARSSRPGWLAALAVGVLSASPLVLIYQGLVVKDVLFADAAVAGFAAVALAATVWDRPVARWTLIGAALALFTLSALTRQNGFIAALAGALSLSGVVLAKRRAPGGRRPARTFALTTLVALAMMGAASTLATMGFAMHSDGQRITPRLEAALAVYDLAGLAHRDPALPLPLLHREAPTLETFIRRDAAAAYDPTRMDILIRRTGWDPSKVMPSPLFVRQWRQSLLSSPALYLATRAEAFRQVFLTPDIEACTPVLVGVDPGSNKLRAAGLTARETDKDDWDGDYVDQAAHSPLLSHLAYAVLAIALIAWALIDVRRGRPEMIPTIGLLGSALLFTASFFVISIACDYRYLYFLDAATMAAFIQRVARWKLRTLRRYPRDR